MIQKMKGFFAICDVCDVAFNVDGINQVYDTKKEATIICRENGWRQLGRKKWACADCSKKIDSLAQNQNNRKKEIHNDKI